MTPRECYALYVAVKAHFSSSFDFFRYNGKVKLPRNSFEDRNDVLHFERLANHHDPKGLLAIHLAENPDAWIGDIVSDQETYLRHRKTIESMTKIFTEELVMFDGSIDRALLPQAFRLPGLLRLYMEGAISLETASIINDLTGISVQWKKTGMMFLIEPLSRRLEKYQPFLVEFLRGDYSRGKFSNIVKDFFKIKT